MRPRPVLLNIDLGELPGEPDELYRLATMVNIACGGHAGDEVSMTRAVTLARASGATIAAHPSYPDREGFGRKTISIAPPDLAEAIASQCSALKQVVARESPGSALRAVKLHGALYHDAARDPAIAEAVIDGVVGSLGATADPCILWVGPAHGELWTRARELGHAYLREAFADRGTLPDGSLIPRGQPGALIDTPARAAAQARSLARSGEVDTLCVHSDTPGALDIARAVRAALQDAGLLASGAP